MEPTGDACLARQAIYDVELAVSGYELLYRSSPAAADSGGSVAEETAMSASTHTAALTDIGLDRIVGDRDGWVNVGAAFLAGDLTAVLPPERAVVARLRSDSYRVALDDFVFRPELEPLVELADIVKVDLLALTEDEVQEQMRLLRPYGVDQLANLIATNVTLS